jgi:cytochrome c oxidase subunit 3
LSVPILFLLVAVGAIGWWLFARQLTAKPWEKLQAAADNKYGADGLSVAPARMGLWVFLAVITSFFGLFISAYSMRMMVGDWQPVAEPRLLALNTAFLVASSLAFQWTVTATDEGNAGRVKLGLLLSGALTIAFLGGQLLAWRELNAAGAHIWSGAAIAFFYLLTGLHGLHLLGGLVVLARTTVMVWRGGSPLGKVRLSVALCATYWHYLLLVWLVLLGLLLAT